MRYSIVIEKLESNYTKSGLTIPFIREDNLLDMRSQKPDELKLC